MDASAVTALADILTQSSTFSFGSAISPGALTPSDPDSPNYSRSGSYGDPTLATSAKGELLLAAMLDDLNEQMASFAAEGPATEQRSDTFRSVL